MKRPWCVHTIGDMIGPPYRNAILPAYSDRDGVRIVTVRHVPPPYRHSRIKAAWFVLLGVAIAVEWPKAGDLEAALLPERLTTPPVPEVTAEQVERLDALVAPEFETGDWQTVESETPPTAR